MTTKNAIPKNEAAPSLTARANRAAKIGDNIRRIQELRRFSWMLENPGRIPELDARGSDNRSRSQALLDFCNFLADASKDGERKYFVARTAKDGFVTVEKESAAMDSVSIMTANSDSRAAPRVIFSRRIPAGIPTYSIPEALSETFPEKAVAALAEVLGQPKVRKQLAKALEAERKELVRKFNDVRAVADYAIAEAYKFADELRNLTKA